MKPTTQIQERLHYMDNLRALAMFVGVLFHASLAYGPLLQNIWLTSYAQNSSIFDVFSFFTHLFRMPLFFLISGFFAMMLIQKRGLSGLLKNRAKRIVLPFIIFLPLLTICVMLAIGWAIDNVENLSPVLSFFKMMQDSPNVAPSPISTMHLWFLYYIFIFVILFSLLNEFDFFKSKILDKILSVKFIFIVFPVLMVPALFSVPTPHPAPDKWYPEIWSIGFYGLFFLLGSLIYNKQNILDEFNKYKHFLLFVSLILFAYFYSTLPDSISTEMIVLMMMGAKMEISHLPVAIAEAYIAVYMTIYCLIIGKKVLNKHNKILKLISDSSYWVYLVHFPLLLIIQFYLMDTTINIWGQFIISITFTFTIALVSYLMIVKPTPIGWLLNGRRTT